jgi:hypothetical protein
MVSLCRNGRPKRTIRNNEINLMPILHGLGYGQETMVREAIMAGLRALLSAL